MSGLRNKMLDLISKKGTEQPIKNLAEGIGQSRRFAIIPGWGGVFDPDDPDHQLVMNQVHGIMARRSTAKAARTFGEPMKYE